MMNEKMYKKVFDKVADYHSEYQLMLEDIVSEKKKNYFNWNKAAVVFVVALMSVVGGVTICGAFGIGPITGFYNSFSSNPEKSVIDSKYTVTSKYDVTLEKYYLDTLGIGQMLFVVESKDGTEIPKTIGDIDNRCKIKYEQNGLVKDFDSSGIPFDTEEIRGEDKKSRGILIQFEAPNEFNYKEDVLILEYEGDDYRFDSIELTSKSCLEWKENGKKVILSQIGMLVEKGTDLEQYLSNSIDEKNNNTSVGTVYYKDGRTEKIELSSFTGCKIDNTAMIKFSPATDLQKKLEDMMNDSGQTWNDIKDLWSYSFSSYYFDFDKIDKIVFGNVVLKLSEAKEV